MTTMQTTVTAENLDATRDAIGTLDQARELEPGCVTWGIYYQPGNQRGQMTRWPSGRGAACFGSDSVWGDWIERDGVSLLRLDDLDSDGCSIYYDETGQAFDAE